MNEFVKMLQKTLPIAKLDSAEKEISVRCPYCGDSRKHSNKGHMNITTYAPYMYRCVKCETCGYVNDKFLHDIGCYDNDVLITVLAGNKEYKKQHKSTDTKKSFDKKIILPKVDSEQSKKCIDYFNSRYNSNYDLDTIVDKFKAVVDIDAFVDENNLNINSGYFNLRESIGFLSTDKTYIIFRDISGQQQIRYFNLCLVGDDMIRNKRYNINVPVDIMKDKITLIMTEGIFDIIGVYNKYYSNDNQYDKIFCATCGKSYTSAIMSFIKKGFLNLDIIIYSDADVDYKWYIDKVKNANEILKNQKITIYYNKLDKDYGIDPNKIDLRKMVI